VLTREAPLRYAVVAIVLWGTLAAVVGHALDGVRPGALLVWSLFFAALTLSLAHLARGGKARQLLPRDGRSLLLGLWGILAYHALFFEALARAPIVEANLLNYLWPLLVVVLAGPLGGQRAGRSALVGAAVGFLGAVIVVTQGRAVSFRREDAVGYACALVAAMAWASFSVLLRRRGDEAPDAAASADLSDPMTGFVNVSLLGALLLASARGDLHMLDRHTLLATAWLGVGPMAAAFLCWERAFRHGSAAKIGALSYLDPLLSTVLLALVLGKPLTSATWIGMALIIGGAGAPTLLAIRLTDGVREP
jgi:drug/metabolite transporter (DMT)-like permease